MHWQKLKRKYFQKTTGGKPLLPRRANLETRRKAKYSYAKCGKDLKSGFLWLCVSGVLSVAYQTEKTVLRKFDFRPVKTYIHASSPWTNIELQAHLIWLEFVSEAEFSVTFWDSHSIKSLLMLLIRCFQILLKKRKLFTWEVQFLID